MVGNGQVEPVDLDADLKELVTNDHNLNLYAGRKAAGSLPKTTDGPVIEATPVLEPGVDLAQESTRIIEAGRKHTETICGMAEKVIDALEEILRGYRTELREKKRERNQADAELVRTVHKVMSAAPRIEAQIRELGTAIRATGG